MGKRERQKVSSKLLRKSARISEHNKRKREEEADKRRKGKPKKKPLSIHEDLHLPGPNDIIVRENSNVVKVETGVENNSDFVKQEQEEISQDLNDDRGINVNALDRVWKIEQFVKEECNIPTSKEGNNCEGNQVCCSSDSTVQNSNTEIIPAGDEAVETVIFQIDQDILVENLQLKEQLAVNKLQIQEFTEKVNSLNEELVEKDAEIKRLKDIIQNSNLLRYSHSFLNNQSNNDIPKISEKSIPQNAWDKRLKKENHTAQNLLDGRLKKAFDILLRHDNEHGQINWAEKRCIVKNIRVISKSWKEAVDALLENEHIHVSLTSHYADLEGFKTEYTPCPLTFSNFGPTKFAQKMVAHHQIGMFSSSFNPCVSRHIMIKLTLCILHWDNFCQDLLQYLQLFGEHIWNFTVFSYPFQCDIKFHRDIPIVKLISDCLLLLPNLKSLTVDIAEFAKHFTKMGESNCWLSTLPEIPHLKDLTTIHFGRNWIMNKMIIRNNQHVQRLYLPGKYFNGNVVDTRIMELKLGNISELFCCVDSNETWNKINALSWNLTKLTLSISGYKVYDLPNIFEVLVTFKKTLKILTLNLTDAHLRNTSLNSNDTLDLPRLTNLHIIYPCQKPVCWEVVLRPLQCLETLMIEHGWRKSGSQTGELKEFWSYVDSFLGQSSSCMEYKLWMDFPELQQIFLVLDFRCSKFHIRETKKQEQFWIKRSSMQTVRLDLVKVYNRKMSGSGRSGATKRPLSPTWTQYRDSAEHKIAMLQSEK